jgi:hypothetical protein
MAERAAHLVDHVFPPDVPVRQWVLSVPHRLRYRLAYDHGLCHEVVRIWSRVRGLARKSQNLRRSQNVQPPGTGRGIARGLT